MHKVLHTDSYKASHFLFLPPDATHSHFYLTGRKGDAILFFGLQAILSSYFFSIPNHEDVARADAFYKAHGLPFNYEGWTKIVEMGYLPLKISAIKEGSIVKGGTPLLCVENTEPGFAWLPGWIETLLMHVWYPCTVATRSWECKQIIRYYLEETGDVGGLNFKLHDFGFRGVSSFESAEMGGMAHLLNFMGTDTVAGITAAMKYYDAEMCGFSIPATEHSVTTSWGKENEAAFIEHVLDATAGQPMVATVGDSYDMDNFVSHIIGDQLRDKIISRGGTLIIRPDSGYPPEAVLKTLQQLEVKFGSHRNKKGYKVLPPHLRVIQGDGIDKGMINKILSVLEANGWSADNIAFGMGGELLQNMSRDTYSFAMKMSAIKRDGVWHDVSKNPKDAPEKASLAGKQDKDMDIIWQDGHFGVIYKWDEVKERIDEQTKIV